MKNISFLAVFMCFLPLSFSQEQDLKTLLSEIWEMKAEIQSLKQQVQQQQQTVQQQQKTISELRSQDSAFQELQREVRELASDVGERNETIHYLEGAIATPTMTDVLEVSPEKGFLLGHSFFVKAGITHDPFENGYGWVLGGALDLKLADWGPGSLLGEIGLSFSRSKDTLDVVTSDVLGAQLNQELRLNTLSADINFKYRLDKWAEPGSFWERFQPYVRGGFSLQVFISDSDSLIAGQVPQAAELEDRNIPAGQGNLYTALNVGAGLEFMITYALFMGIDYGHYELFTENGRSDTLTLTTGLRF